MPEKISRVLFQTSELRLSSTVSLPSFSYYKKKGSEEYSDPMMDKPDVFLNLMISPKSRKELPFEEKVAFILEPEYYELTKAWMEVLSWFYDSDKRDLFVIDDNNQLQFNAAYGTLIKVVTDSKRYPQKITVLPTLVQRGEKSYEGVMIHMRSIDIQTTLTIHEFGTLVRTLQQFSFVSEQFFMTTAYMYAETHRRVKENTGFNKLSTESRVSDVINGTVIQNRGQKYGFQLK